ncbi:hypothetical protein EJB05_14374 [Eragrostis curvula]|uniref:Uncharacterized protein n=1 Tax=Eragrostis curvula TaxID=38414 RepID=A0A5J9VZ27_9POAL|nr:hypothetical protein EJB05_14374 [Eragrostis curvula]
MDLAAGPLPGIHGVQPIIPELGGVIDSCLDPTPGGDNPSMAAPAPACCFTYPVLNILTLDPMVVFGQGSSFLALMASVAPPAFAFGINQPARFTLSTVFENAPNSIDSLFAQRD